ncbi:MAG: lipid A deacylase LpxR family protein, partial [Pikeienuella sp.]
GIATAQSSRPSSEGGTVSFTLENDIFGGTDRNYTNGARFDYVTPKNDLPSWARFARDQLLPIVPAENWYASYAIGQNMYTPADIEVDIPAANDRPYAGFLYGSIGLAADSGQELDSIALEIGVIGAGSLAEETQKFVHRLIGSPQPRGWDTQIGDFPGVRLLYEKKYRYGSSFELGFLPFQADVAPHFNVSLGNVDTSAGVGLTVRIGDDLVNDYGPPRVRPAVSGPGFFEGSSGFGWTVFAGVEARAVGYNGFIQGGRFKDESNVEPHRVVGDVQAGVSLQYGDVELTYTHVIRTPEFGNRQSLSIFGSVNLRTKF